MTKVNIWCMPIYQFLYKSVQNRHCCSFSAISTIKLFIQHCLFNTAISRFFFLRSNQITTYGAPKPPVLFVHRIYILQIIFVRGKKIRLNGKIIRLHDKYIRSHEYLYIRSHEDLFVPTKIYSFPLRFIRSHEDIFVPTKKNSFPQR